MLHDCMHHDFDVKSHSTCICFVVSTRMLTCSVNTSHLLTYQPRVTVTLRFVYKVIKDLISIDHFCINPILRIGLTHLKVVN